MCVLQQAQVAHPPAVQFVCFAGPGCTSTGCAVRASEVVLAELVKNRYKNTPPHPFQYIDNFKRISHIILNLIIIEYTNNNFNCNSNYTNTKVHILT